MKAAANAAARTVDQMVGMGATAEKAAKPAALVAMLGAEVRGVAAMAASFL